MLLSKVHSEKRAQYLNTVVQIKSAMVQGEAVLKAFHNSQAVVTLQRGRILSSKCKTNTQRIVLNTEHVIVV
jgi:hypothetical protein